MKIAVATDNFKTVTGHVGRCKGFIVMTVENGVVTSKEEIENDFTNHGKGNHEHNHDHHNHNHEHHHEHAHSHEGLANGLSGCDCLISAGMGMRLVNDIKMKGIVPVITDVKDAEEAAILMEQGNLTSLEHKACRH